VNEAAQAFLRASVSQCDPPKRYENYADRVNEGAAAYSDFALAAYAETVSWTRANPTAWVMTAAVALLGAWITLHVAIGLGWPFAQSRNGGGTEEGSNRMRSSAR
jgi:hypothetical protein